jgi:hypothetical protein
MALLFPKTIRGLTKADSLEYMQLLKLVCILELVQLKIAERESCVCENLFLNLPNTQRDRNRNRATMRVAH